MTILVIVVCLFSLLLIGVPVAFALGGIGLGMLFLGEFSPLMAPQAILSTLDGFILLAVPLFLLMSNVLLKGGVGRDLFGAVQAWVGHWPGGLAVATILSCGLFAAISGSSVLLFIPYYCPIGRNLVTSVQAVIPFYSRFLQYQNLIFKKSV